MKTPKQETITIDGTEYVRKDSISQISQKAKSLKGMPYVMIRTYSAGVHCGYLKSRKDGEVTLLNARRIWYWDGAASLSQLAMEGTTKPELCKFPMEVSEIRPEIDLEQVIEVQPCTEQSKKSIEEVKVYENA